MSGETTRLTLYVLISALEDDLRAVLSDHVLTVKHPESVFDGKLLALLRVRKDADSLESSDDSDLVLFLNIGDAIDVVRRESSFMGVEAQKDFKKHLSALVSLIPIRNRVMHGRPLLFDDSSITTEVCRKLVRAQGSLWRNVAAVLEKLQSDKSFLLSVDFSPEANPDENVLHNLPLADFDDTGFIGRSEELDKIDRALKGAFPVITITGEGGLGKTALALKACYDLIDSTDCPFEAVVWTTAKTTKLTTNEIKAIDGAISTSLGIFENASEVLDAEEGSDPLEKLLNQLETFPILLVIDNLETVLDQNIKSLVERVPRNSKILFTSKASIGAFDFPIPLTSFSLKESAYYLRSVARFWGLDAIHKSDQSTIADYCKKLQHNPLFLKWFVQAVAGGQSPQKVIANRKIILEFCLSFVIDKLSDPSRMILDALTFLSSSQSEASILYYTQLNQELVQKGLNELISSNLVRFATAKSADLDQEYIASDLATLFIRSYVKETTINEKEIIARKKSLTFEREKNSSLGTLNYFDMNNVYVRGDSDLITAKILKDAMAALKSNDLRNAQKIAGNAREMSPSYFETHRVLATIYAKDNQLMKAQQSFEEAISYKVDHPPLRLWFGDFLLKSMEDYDGAVEQYDLGLQQNGASAELIAAKARHHFIMRKFDEGLELIISVEALEALTGVMRRRFVDLHCQYYIRFIKFSIEQDKFDHAIDLAVGFKNFIDSLDLNLVRAVTLTKIRALSSSIERLAEHNSVLHPSESVTEVCEWFGETFLSGNVSLNRLKDWEASGEDEVFEGEIRSVLSGFGFINTEKGELFFAKSHWCSPQPITEESVGMEVLFKLGKNSKGFMAMDVRPKSKALASDNRITGEFYADNTTYGFILANDGESFFFPYSEFKPRNSEVDSFVGRTVSFDVDDAKQRGGNRAAKDVRLV